ncbi:MAG TPA: transglutaminase family protein [Xanthobacteraceae bacterium]|nr:transglutaminase family protein [Xanthobacteraceae bacterium]
MRFSVRHDTLSRYSAPVGLAPHLLRLTPRAERVRMLASELTVEPVPAARRESMDRFGNRITQVSFDGPSELLRVESYFDLEISAPAPLRDSGLPRFPWSCGPQRVPADYWPEDRQDPAVQSFAETLASESGWAALPFLEHLSQTLFRHFHRDIRIEGAAQAPARTLATGRGACRDLTMLFMAACRSLGIAARFVSGYQAHADTPGGERHLHAWPEVLLPDAGWRGFDPTHGVAVSDGHVALCAAPDQAATMPIEGGFYGNGVTATLDYRVRIATPGA